MHQNSVSVAFFLLASPQKPQFFPVTAAFTHFPLLPCASCTQPTTLSHPNGQQQTSRSTQNSPPISNKQRKERNEKKKIKNGFPLCRKHTERIPFPNWEALAGRILLPLTCFLSLHDWAHLSTGNLRARHTLWIFACFPVSFRLLLALWLCDLVETKKKSFFEQN